MQWYRSQTGNCVIPDCRNNAHAKGLCVAHYAQDIRQTAGCSIDRARPEPVNLNTKAFLRYLHRPCGEDCGIKSSRDMPLWELQAKGLAPDAPVAHTRREWRDAGGNGYVDIHRADTPTRGGITDWSKAR